MKLLKFTDSGKRAYFREALIFKRGPTVGVVTRPDITQLSLVLIPTFSGVEKKNFVGFRDWLEENRIFSIETVVSLMGNRKLSYYGAK